jgi:hypothetical protein
MGKLFGHAAGPNQDYSAALYDDAILGSCQARSAGVAHRTREADE